MSRQFSGFFFHSPLKESGQKLDSRSTTTMEGSSKRNRTDALGVVKRLESCIGLDMPSDCNRERTLNHKTEKHFSVSQQLLSSVYHKPLFQIFFARRSSFRKVYCLTNNSAHLIYGEEKDLQFIHLRKNLLFEILRKVRTVNQIEKA